MTEPIDDLSDQGSSWRIAELRERQRFNRGQACERAKFEAQQQRDRDAFEARMMLQRPAASSCPHFVETVPPETQRPDLGLRDLIPAAEAAGLVHRAKSTMASWCRRHAIDGSGEGFSVQIKGRWLVSRSRLLRHLASGSRD